MLSKNADIANILFGPTQYGKSTFLNAILDKDEDIRPKTGTGNGQSVTRVSRLYRNTLIGPTIDVPGTNDTGLLLDAEQISQQVTLILAEERISEVRFLIFDSMSDSSTQIRPTLEHLIQAFGHRSRRSIVIIGSKFDRVDEENLEGRLAAMEDAMADCGIMTKLVFWKSKNVTPEEWSDQVKDLLCTLRIAHPTTLTELQALEARVFERAKALYDEQAPEMREQEIQFKENHAVKRMVTETYEVTEMERVKIADSNMIIAKNVAAGLATYILSFGVGFAIDAALNGGNPVYEYRPKVVTKTREVPHWDNVERTVTKRIWVPEMKPLSSFMDSAYQEILRETRETLKSKTVEDWTVFSTKV